MKKIINNYKKWNPSKYATALLLLTPLAMFIIRGFEINNDFWFLINLGKEIVKNGFITIEPFTIHSNLFFIPQQWLTDVIFYFIYNYLGVWGMYFFILFCCNIITFIIYKTIYLVTNDNKSACLISIIFSSLLIISYGIVTRPQVFDAIIFSLEIFLLESFVIKGKKKYLYLLPFLSILLINLHASVWAMFLVFMAPYYAEYLVFKLTKKEDSLRINPLIVFSLLSLLAGFINPYGIKAITYIFGSYGIEVINILVSEMRPVTVSTGILHFIIILVILYSFYCNKGKNKARYVFLMFGTSYLSLKHYRGLLFLLIVGGLLIGYNFKRGTRRKNIDVCLRDKIIYLVFACSLVLTIILGTKFTDDVYIKEFANYLDANANYDIKLFTGYNDGPYMEYRGYKCYLDARAEIFLKASNKKEDILFEYYNMLVGNLNVDNFLEKYHFDYLLVDTNHIILLNALMEKDNYEIVLSKEVDTGIYYLFKRISSES